jgi:hypothetical protein
MDTLQKQKNDFKVFFKKFLQEQNGIRQELIGQSIAEIFYTPEVEGWDIDIKDATAIHLPYGYLNFTTISGQYYRINTNYQTFWGGIFGIALERRITNETHNSASVPLINYMLSDERWTAIKGAKISQIDWNWKREPNCRLDGQTLTTKKAEKYLFEDSFAPDNLVFHFDNGMTVYFFALEPDEENYGQQTYKLLSGGEEIMIFFSRVRLQDWGISSLGFQILVD